LEKSLINIQYFKTPFGDLVIGSYDDKLCLCDWRYRKSRDFIDKRIQIGLNAQYKKADSNIIGETQTQLEAYFKRTRSEFNIPLLLVGSDFQKRIWNELLQIPYGKTETYLGLSRKIGNEKAVRAVATANGANAISIIVPCHRIVGSNGDLVGYAGGIGTKKKLLQLENVLVDNQLSLF